MLVRVLRTDLQELETRPARTIGTAPQLFGWYYCSYVQLAFVPKTSQVLASSDARSSSSSRSRGQFSKVHTRSQRVLCFNPSQGSRAVRMTSEELVLVRAESNISTSQAYEQNFHILQWITEPLKLERENQNRISKSGQNAEVIREYSDLAIARNLSCLRIEPVILEYGAYQASTWSSERSSFPPAVVGV